MNIAKISIRQPVFITMIMTVLVVIGYMGYTRLSVDLFPDTSNPMVSVSTTYSGAGPAEVQRQITQTLEDALSTLNGVVNLRSTSRENSSNLNVEFTLETDPKASFEAVRERVDTGGSFRAPMAIAVIGGLITSTLLTLIVVPTFYNLLDAAQDRLLRRAPAPQPASAPASE